MTDTNHCIGIIELLQNIIVFRLASKLLQEVSEVKGHIKWHPTKAVVPAKSGLTSS